MKFHAGITVDDNYRPYFSTWTGIKFFPGNATIDMIDIRDIAHALSIVRRYGGHTNKGLSSGQHSLLVSKYMPQPYKLRGLLHDASDAYVSDIVAPLKHLPSMLQFRIFENDIQNLIYKKYKLLPIMTSEENEELKKWDLAALAAEARCLTNHNWWQTVPGYELITENIIPLPDEVIEAYFLTEFDLLIHEREKNEKVQCSGDSGIATRN
jgi:hypothetical protein